MRLRPLLHLALAFAALARVVSAQDAPTQSERMADGLIPGDYLRVAGGTASPFRASGSLRDWDRGSSVGAMWENWQSTSGGVGIVGFGLGVDLALLPLNEQQFKTSFSNGSNGALATASGANARILQIGFNTRFRIPSPFAMPHLSLGLGYLDWHPGTIRYTTTTGGSGSVNQQHRSGAALSFAGGIDKYVYDRFAIYGEASWVYGFTSYGSGLATPTGVCPQNNCDILKNTSLVTLRGGLRVRAGR